MTAIPAVGASLGCRSPAVRNGPAGAGKPGPHYALLPWARGERRKPVSRDAISQIGLGPSSRLGRPNGHAYAVNMEELAQALALAALVAATLEYAILLRHREERRDDLRWREAIRESLLSVRRVDSWPVRRWTDDGTRFRLVR